MRPEANEEYFRQLLAPTAAELEHVEQLRTRSQFDRNGRVDRASVTSVTPSRPHTWQPVDLLAAELDPPEPPTIGPGLFYPGLRHVVSGPGEACKSWLLLAAATIELRAGRSVLWIDFEQGRQETLGRLRNLQVADDDVRRFLYVQPVDPIWDALGDVQELLEETRPTLVVIDAFLGLLGQHALDENSGLDVERAWRDIIEPLRHTGAAVVLIDHVVKDRDRRDGPIGSQRKKSGADVVLGVDIVAGHPFGRGHTGRVTVTTLKDRPGWLPRPRAADVELRSAPDGTVTITITPGRTQSVGQTTRRTWYMEQISRFLEESPGATAAAIEKSIGKRADWVRQARDLLVTENYVDVEHGGQGRPSKYTSTRLYREAEDPTPSTPSDPVPTPSRTGSVRTSSTPSTPVPNGRGGGTRSPWPHEP
jgi:hypothetical protein